MEKLKGKGKLELVPLVQSSLLYLSLQTSYHLSTSEWLNAIKYKPGEQNARRALQKRPSPPGPLPLKAAELLLNKNFHATSPPSLSILPTLPRAHRILHGERRGAVPGLR